MVDPLTPLAGLTALIAVAMMAVGLVLLLRPDPAARTLVSSFVRVLYALILVSGGCGLALVAYWSG